MKLKPGGQLSGDDIYVRPLIENEIYEHFDNGNDVFISGPRRAGKSSVMVRILENPRPNNTTIFLSVMSIFSRDEFYRRLIQETLNSKYVGFLKRSYSNGPLRFPAARLEEC